MKLVTPKIDMEIKYKKVSADQLVPQPVIIMRAADGKPVERGRETGNGTRLETFHWKYYAGGEEVSSKDIHYFEVGEDGSEREVRPFDRTSIINIVKEVPRASVEGTFLIESTYELFFRRDKKTSEAEYDRTLRLLYEEAERYFKDDLAGLAVFSWGNGFKQYYAIVYPVFNEEKFVWVMNLTQTKIVYQNLMEIPTVKTPVTQPPTLEMPSVEALLTV